MGTGFAEGSYFPVDTSKRIRTRVAFMDMGPCVTDANDVNWFLENEKTGTLNGYIVSRIEFHGYPAIRKFTVSSDPYFDGTISIGMNNRYYVIIQTFGPGYTEEEAEANIEKFANAIDFNGIASA